jgi:hypothetical protein
LKSRHRIAHSDRWCRAKTGPSPTNDRQATEYASHIEQNFGLSGLPKRAKHCSKLKHNFLKEQHQKSIMPIHNCRPTTTNSHKPTMNNPTTSIRGYLAAFLGTDAFTNTDLYAGSFCHQISQIIAHTMDVDGSFFCWLNAIKDPSIQSVINIATALQVS